MNGADVRAVAIERLREQIQIAQDPATEPAAAEQAAIHALLLMDGLERFDTARAKLADNRGRLATLTEVKATVRAYRRWQAKRGRDADTERPTQEQIARERGMSERSLAGKLREAGIRDWHAVHAIVEAWPDD